MKNGKYYIFAFTLGVIISMGFNYSYAQLTDTNSIDTTGKIIAPLEFQKTIPAIFSKNKEETKTEYSINELQLIELQKINNRLANIEQWLKKP